MALCFYVNFYRVDPDIGQVLKGTFVPTIPDGAMVFTIGLVGSVIMPHNLHLHSQLVLSRELDASNPSIVREANKYNAIESSLSLFMAFTINFAIIGTFAYFYLNGYANLTLLDASDYLEMTFGTTAKMIWAVGLLAGGQSSTMTGTYAGQFVMEGFFEIKLPVWKRVIFTRLISILPALSVCFMHNVNEIFNVINVMQSIQLPFALIPLIKFTSDERIMGKEFANSNIMMRSAIVCGFALFSFNIIGLYPTNGILNTDNLIT